MNITKYVLPVVVGAMIGMILIVLGEKCVVYMKYPPPAGTDFYDATSLGGYIKTLPPAAFVMLLITYAVCSYIAGIVSTLIANRESVIPAIAVGIALTISGIYYIFTMPQPVWYSLASMFTFLPFVYLGYLTVRKKQLNTDSADLA